MKGRTAPAPVPVGQRAAAGGGLNVVSSTVVVATVSFRVATPSHQAEKVQCVVLGCVFNHVSRKSLLFFFCGSRKGFLPKKLASRLSVCLLRQPNRVESSLHVFITHHTWQKSIATILPVTQNNRGQKSLAPTCQARGWRSVAICHRIQHRANLHNGPAMATCHKGLSKAPCLVLAHGLAGRKRWIFQTITVIHVLYLGKQYNTATTVHTSFQHRQYDDGTTLTASRHHRRRHQASQIRHVPSCKAFDISMCTSNDDGNRSQGTTLATYQGIGMACMPTYQGLNDQGARGDAE